MSGTPGFGPRTRDPRSVRAAARLYAAAARLLPPAMRREHGEELRQDFRSLALRAHERSGAAGVAIVLVRGLADVVVRSPGERWRERGAVERAALAIGPRRPTRRRRHSTRESMRVFLKEPRQSARTLAARPGFTLVSVLTLGLGIAANVAIFAVVNAVLIQPLPYPDSERMVVVGHHAPGLNLDDLHNSPGTFNLYHRSARSFSALAAVSEGERNLTGGDRPERVAVVQASPEFFDVVGVQPLLGRSFTEEDVELGAPAVAVLTHGGWAARFGRDGDIVGRVVELDRTPTTIVGVMPRGFQYPDDETVAIVPRRIDPNGPFGNFGTAGLARLAPGVSLEEARREVASLQPRLIEMFPDLDEAWFERAGWSTSVKPLREVLVGDVESALWIIMATVGFVLLIACANVANLFLVRAEAREREVAVRTALGATRGRLASGVLSESLLLGLAGGVLGTALAAAAVRGLVAAGPEHLPRLHEVALDGTTLFFALAISVLAGLAFGALPLPRYLGRSFAGALRDGRGTTAGRERHRARRVLIVSQVALALVLLTASGLMLRSFQRLQAVDLGFRPAGVLTLGVSFAGYQEAEATAFYRRIVDEVAGVAGVQAVGVTRALPLRGDVTGSSFFIASRPRGEDEMPPVSWLTPVTPGYFDAIGMRLLEGRPMEPLDMEAPRRVMWVNRAFARRFLDGEALGERISFASGDTAFAEVVGVVDDVRSFGLREEIRPIAYFPLTEATVAPSLMYLAVRTAGDPMALLPAVRAAARRVHGDVPLTTAQPMEAIVAENMAETSFTMTVLGIAALVALLLGAIGLYGVISYVVSQRSREIGVRIALGAVPASVRSMMLRQGLTTVGVGLLVGLAAALALTRLMEGLLYEVSARDPLTFGAVVLVLLLVSAAASWLPARRASRVSPLEALRAE